MQGIELPDDLDEVLDDPQYLTEKTIAAFIQRWENIGLDDPRAALECADIAVELARSIGAVMLAQTLSLRGAALRDNGRYEDSKNCFEEALSLVCGRSPAAEADILRRLAGLRVAQGALDDALTLTDRSIELCRCHGTEEQIGKALMAKGTVFFMMGRHSDAAYTLTNSLEYISPNTCPITYFKATHNLGATVVELGDFDALCQICTALKKARKKLPRNASIARMKLRWVEGLALIRLGCNNRAFGTLSDVHTRLQDVGTPQDKALLAIDLAQACLGIADQPGVCSMLTEALEHLKSIHGVHPDAVASVERCLDCINTGAHYPWSVRRAVSTAGRAR